MGVLAEKTRTGFSHTWAGKCQGKRLESRSWRSLWRSNLNFWKEVWYCPHQNMSLLPSWPPTNGWEGGSVPCCLRREFRKTRDREASSKKVCLLHVPPLTFLMSYINCSFVLSVKQLETKWTLFSAPLLWIHCDRSTQGRLSSHQKGWTRCIPVS